MRERKESDMRLKAIKDERRNHLAGLIRNIEINLKDPSSDQMKQFWEDQLKKTMNAYASLDYE